MDRISNSKKAISRRTVIVGILYLLPFLILYTTFTIWPVIQGVYVSLHKWGLMGMQEFVGLSNYERLLGDPYFWNSLKNTVVFVIITVPMLIIVALYLALLANRVSKLKKFYRCCFYIPSVLSVASISLIARAIGAPYVGFLNGFLHALGFPESFEPLWFQDLNLVWVSISWTTVWWTVGFSMLLYLSALQDISSEIYEASELDGATKAQQLLRITIPLLKPTTYLILMLQIIASFKVFGQIFLISGGGPGRATRPIIQYIYEWAFRNNEFGYGSAMSYMVFIILIILTFIQLFVQRKGEEK